MAPHTTAVSSRRRAVGLSVAISMMTLSGFTAVTAQAADVTLEATVELCTIDLSVAGPRTMVWAGDAGSAYAFTAEGANAIALDWSANGDCAGNLKAHRNEIIKVDDETEIEGASLSLDSDLIVKTLANAVTVSNIPGPESFDVTMIIPVEAAPGTFSTILTFTVVAG